MRLFTLFISYGTGGHYCGVYPTMEYLYSVICEMTRDMEIDKSEIPILSEILNGINGNAEDYWHKFSDGTWIYVQEASEQLIGAIKDTYGLKKRNRLKKIKQTATTDNKGDNRRRLKTLMRKLWEKLGDIPIDKDERTEEPFEHFPAGTDRCEIWHWFEDEFDIEVVSLLYPGEKKHGRIS